MLKMVSPLLVRVGLDYVNNKFFQVGADEKKLLVHGCAAQAISLLVKGLYTIGGCGAGVVVGGFVGRGLSLGNLQAGLAGMMLGGTAGALAGFVAGDLKSCELATGALADSEPNAVTKEQVARLHKMRMIQNFAFVGLLALVNASKISELGQRWKF